MKGKSALVRTLVLDAERVRPGDVVRVAGAALRVESAMTNGDERVLHLEDGNRLVYHAQRFVEVLRAWHDATTMTRDIRALGPRAAVRAPGTLGGR